MTWCGSPCTSSSPSCMTSTVSETDRIAFITCSTTRIVISSSLSERINSKAVSISRGRSPAITSSSSSSRGRIASAFASSRRRASVTFSPPGSASACSASPTRSSTSSARARLARRSGARGSEHRADRHVLAHVELAERLDDLERARDLRIRDRPGPRAGHVAAADHHAPGRGFQVAGDEVDQCALARAVGPDDTEDLRLAEAEGDVVDGREPAEAAAELLDLEDRGHSRYARIVSSRDIRRWAHESRANETIPIGSSTTANEEVADALRRSDTPKI